jgi:hypothetical protein
MQTILAVADQLNARVSSTPPQKGTRAAKHENQKTNENLRNPLRRIQTSNDLMMITFQVLMNTTTPLV